MAAKNRVLEEVWTLDLLLSICSDIPTRLLAESVAHINLRIHSCGTANHNGRHCHVAALP